MLLFIIDFFFRNGILYSSWLSEVAACMQPSGKEGYGGRSNSETAPRYLNASQTKDDKNIDKGLEKEKDYTGAE